LIRILHLEDSPDDAFLVESLLKREKVGMKYLCVGTRKEYLKALAEFRPEVVLCDHTLPDYSSTDALETLRSEYPYTPFILVSGVVSEEAAVNIMKAGANDYLAKDRLQRLPQAVFNAIQKAKAEKEKLLFYDQIQSAERKFRRLIENSHEAILLIDSQHLVVYRSPADIQITGWPDESILRTSFFDLVHPDDRGRLLKLMNELGQDPSGRVQAIFRRKHQSDIYIWIEAVISNLLTDKDVQAYVVNCRDISERKRSEELQRRSEANLRTIFDSTSISFVLLDRNLHIVSFNQEAMARYKTALGATLKEGNDITAYLPEERKELMRERFTAVLSGQKVSYEASFPDEKNGLTWYHVNFTPVTDENGYTYGLIISSEDITYRKQIEIEREKMTADVARHHKDLEQFTYMVSHNLRSPVANIKGLASLMSGDSQLTDEEFKRCLDGLVSSVNKLDNVIADLNDILRSGKRPGERMEPVTLSGIIAEVKAISSGLIEKENILIHTNFTVDRIYTIKSYLHSILLNLLTNSIKYRRPSGPAIIGVHSRMENNRIVIAYRDNGIGIDLEKYGNKLFGIYSKLDPHADGMGLGLYMIKTQVELLGGSIRVMSEPGKGTEFIIELTNHQPQ
jgi:PAS domain S-box-containing protein